MGSFLEKYFLENNNSREKSPLQINGFQGYDNQVGVSQHWAIVFQGLWSVIWGSMSKGHTNETMWEKSSQDFDL